MGTLTTRGFHAPKLRLRPVRSEESVRLDTDVSEGPVFTPWGTFTRELNFQQGEHCTLVGTTGSGKTTLARELLIPQREYVVVLATKVRDESLYEPLIQRGFILTDKFKPNPDDDQPHKIIFRPPLDAPTTEAMKSQSERFREALIAIFQHGGWAVYADEVRYLTDNLKLHTQFETLWLQGRSLKVSIIASTQRPVSIPLLAFDSATHLFLWRNTDRVNIQRMAEFAGADIDVVRYIIPRLPRHEFLYIDTRTGRMTRSKVEL